MATQLIYQNLDSFNESNGLPLWICRKCFTTIVKNSVRNKGSAQFLPRTTATTHTVTVCKQIHWQQPVNSEACYIRSHVCSRLVPFSSALYLRRRQNAAALSGWGVTPLVQVCVRWFHRCLHTPSDLQRHSCSRRHRRLCLVHQWSFISSFWED